ASPRAAARCGRRAGRGRSCPRSGLRGSLVVARSSTVNTGALDPEGTQLLPPLTAGLPIMHWPPTGDDFARLRDTLGWVVEHSPYYRGLLDGAGVRVAELDTYDAFRRRVPRTAKTDLVANQRAHPPFGEFLAVPRSEF